MGHDFEGSLFPMIEANVDLLVKNTDTVKRVMGGGDGGWGGGVL